MASADSTTATGPAAITRALTLGHRGNAGVDVEQVELAAGDAVEILAEWSEHYLIRNEAGQLFNAPKDAGVHQVVWDGRDDAGSRVPSGVYFLKIFTDGLSETKRLVRLR